MIDGKTRAEKGALELLDELLIYKPPVDPVSIAKRLGIDIKIADFTEEDILGFYNETEKVIYVKKSDPFVRQSFTISHELGHFVLHRGHINNNGYEPYRRDFGFNKNAIEREADAFAANLLVPEKMLKEVLSNVAFRITIDDIAKIFAVSRDMMARRLRYLGLI
jgi:Zn-dependent peptidase ImmA (M78 family)